MKHIVVLMGMPGAGKDTQADLLETNHGYDIIRVGELVRSLAKKNKLVDSEQHSGELAEPEIVDGIVAKAIEQAKSSEKIVCDGYPRTLAQAEKLVQICKDQKAVIEQVIYLKIPVAEVHKRLSLRNREDDSARAINNRLQIFNNNTQPVLDYYAKTGQLNAVSGVGSIEAVERRILKVLKKL